MTGPVASEPGTDAHASQGMTGLRDSARAIGTVLAAGLAFRLIIAYLLPGSGFKTDLGAFQYWASNLAQQGPLGFYDRGFFADYTPGYLYALWGIGLIADALGKVGIAAIGPFTYADLLKLPAILADLAIGYLIYRFVLDLGASKRRALIGAAIFLFSPISWFDSTVWGQVDSFGVVFLLLGVRELWHDHPERAAIWATVAAVIKPQLGILVPLVAAVVIRRYLFDAPDAAPSRWQRATARGTTIADRMRAWGARERGPTRIVTTATAGLATAVLLSLPFGLTIIDLLGQIANAAGGYPYLSVNAYNPWALISQGGNGVAANGLWIRDSNGPDPGDVGFAFGPIPAVLVGTGLLLVAVAVVCWLVARRPDRLQILVGLAVLSLAFFVLPTRVHERYLYPFFAIGAILAAVSGRWRVAYVALTVVNFMNMYVVLTTLYPDNPQISDWLGIGPDIRSMTTVTLVALVHLGGFIWVSAQMRRRAERRLIAEIATGRERDEGPIGEPEDGLPEVVADDGITPDDAIAPWQHRPAGVVAGPMTEGALGGAAALSLSDTGSAAAGPHDDRTEPTTWQPDPTLERRRSWTDPPDAWQTGMWASFRRAVLTRPIRADRTAALLGEKGGRIDRLDVWFFVVVIVAALTLRTFRLSEPYSMHFDEVYHARTATEFLQDWRYGIPHDIYEYTHPHVAKYFMAAGLVAFGDDQVKSQGNLGTAVRDAAIELRWDDANLPNGYAGDRVYVASGSDVRAFDLSTRALVATIAVAGASAVAVDQTAHRLYIGTDTGQIVSVDTSAGLDPLRANPASPSTGPPTEPFATTSSAVQELLVPTDGADVLARTAASDAVSFDATTGATVGRVHIVGLSDLVGAGTTQQVVAQPALLPDRSAAASLLAQLLGKPQADVLAQLNPSASTVLLGAPPTASARTSFDQATTDGRLPGVSVQSLPQVAAVSPTGLTFFSPSSALVTQQLNIAGATGAAYITGLDAPRIYVAAGKKVSIARLATDQTAGAPAYVEATINMPGEVQKVTFDPSTEFVQVLGRTGDGTASTIYEIESHGNAVFADAHLPFTPAAWVTDAQPQYPSQDRQTILALSADGGAASVDIGNNPFAWRLPGVILGAFTAGLLYLLARILFRRRSIAIFVGILCLADGMAYVQSRIGMNDVYVGFFIVAAYTLFAAIWTKQIQRRWVFWLAMPTIGILLGLALSSKWVGLYAMAGIGILVLARSALGRLIIVLAMIGGTTVLGYMALSVPAGATNGGNLTFVLIMIALTIAAVVIAVLHPIAWSVEEVRFAIGAPAALGILTVLVALPLGKLSSGAVVGPVKVTGLTAGLGLVLLSGAIAAGFWVAGRFGFGPLAPPTPPEIADRLTPAAPAPEGWLRLGTGYGIPAAWMGASLLVIPIVVYVISYLPWIALGNRLTDAWPPGNHGQTLIQLTQSMYDYHNNLRAPHAASSPWWAWPLDLKPVWFYQGSFDGQTAASIYDAGNLVIWWLSIPAMIFCAWQAYRRRSLALALVVLGFAWQWLPWSRIDRATFQYHYYTSVPFVILALGYLLGELWHGASRRTWLVAKVAAAVAVVGPALLWVGKGPLCRYVRVEAVNPGSQACVGNPGDLVITARVAVLVLVVGIAVIALVYQLLRLNSPPGGGGGGGGAGGGGGLDLGPDGTAAVRRGPLPRGLAQIAVTAVLAGIGIAIADRIAGESVVFEVRGFQSTYLALLLAIPLLLIGGFILTARDARRFVAGTAFAIVAAFLLIYPNISALPLPSTVVNAYQGLLPTYLYPFQFPVNTDPAAPGPKLFALEPALLLIALTITCLVVGYAAWVWRIGPVEHPTSGDGGLPAGGEA